MPWIEWVGYTGSVLIAVSMMMNNIWRLRWISLAGAGAFAAYGLIVNAYPVFVLNAFIVVANIYYLRQMATQKDFFSLLSSAEQPTLRERFLEFHREDIARLFPEFKWDASSQTESVFVLRNLMPVGLFMYEPKPDGVIEIKLDYVVPTFRDLKNSHFVFSAKAGELRAKGFRTFVARSYVATHQSYLRKVGFEQDSQDLTVFRKKV